jgi:hypothetical protein
MSFPGLEQDNPQRVSAAVNTAGFAQDVVVATSRLIHRQEPTERDRQTLDNCHKLLQWMQATDNSLTRSGEQQLAATNTVALLRQTRGTQDEVITSLAQGIEAIDALLGGDYDEDYIQRVRNLRETFLAIGEINLAAMTQRNRGQEDSDSWTTLIASSHS